MSLILDGTNGVSDIDGTAATPAICGTDANTGIFFPAADVAAISTGGTERMRITSGGALSIGTTGTPTGSTGGAAFVPESSSRRTLFLACTTTASTVVAAFINPNGFVGSISTTGSSTLYGTTSDYRLKDNVAPMTDALGVVQQLKPVTYNWKVDGSSGQGFIAHELQEVVPDCVTGEKDAVETVDDVDLEGKVIGTKEVPKYQGIDTSFLVATLTAAIQELKVELDSVKAELATLKA